MDTDAAKVRVGELVDGMAEELISLSHQIHDNPELNFEEHFAHQVLTDAIAAHGHDVTRGAYGLETAFEAKVGSSGPMIAVCCEYDALPGIGHACGHNVIATAGLGAGLAAAALANDLGGRVSILGTPAEEGGGGKVFMIERGAFKGIDASLMVHPAAADLTVMNTIAIHRVNVTFNGESAHAAAAPQEGRNALDAAVLAYNSVAALRQHILPDERIHGIFTDGGQKPNIVPSSASMEWYVRSPTLASLQPLKERVVECFQAGAMATGTTATWEWIEPPYADMIDNEPFLSLYAANAQTLGRTVTTPAPENRVVGSTDMGNVSYEVPSIHPMIKVATDGSPIHTPKFAEHARSKSGDQAVVDGAKAMAMTIVDLWTDPKALAAVTRDFEAST